jgi:hypothetical protein
MLRTSVLLFLAFSTGVLSNITMAEELGALLVPSHDVSVNVPLMSQTTDVEVWTQTILGTTTTSDQALSVWCNVISAETPAVAVSNSLLTASDIADCPSAQGRDVLQIHIDPLLMGAGSAVLPENSGSPVFLYLRSKSADYRDLSGIGKGLLYPSYGESVPDLFRIGRQGGNEDTFFPNFCQMCDCCQEYSN